MCLCVWVRGGKWGAKGTINLNLSKCINKTDYVIATIE